MTKLVQSEVDFQTIKISLDPILQTSEVVDNTWLKNSSAWLVEKSVLLIRYKNVMLYEKRYYQVPEEVLVLIH